MSENRSEIITVWQDAVKSAEQRCEVALHTEIESYLVSLLIRFAKRPDLARKVIATEFMQAMQENSWQRHQALAEVGDQCLLLSGLFPGVAEKRCVKVSYFVDLGRSAYAHLSIKATDLYGSLAIQFVMLMDVLQCLNQRHVLLPLNAYELWQDIGSQRALKVLREYGLRA